MQAMNLLFILTDQQRYDTVQKEFDGTRVMPALAELADSGTQFTRCYCSQPICTPARGTLMTGLWPHQHGCGENNLALDWSIPTIAELAVAGKRNCAHFGKWHLGDELFAQHGFTIWESIEDQYNNYFRPEREKETRSTYHQFLTAHGCVPQKEPYFTRLEAAHMPLSLTKPAFITDRVCDYLRSQVGKSEPFMAFASFLEPHPPYTGPYDDLFDWEQIELPENFNQLPGAIDSVKASLMGIYYRLHGSSGFTLSSDDDWRRLIARYYGLCRQVDEGIGKLMHTLEETGLAENTIVVFTSDHGDQMGDHNCLQKGVLYEESIRVPLILRTPGKPGNRQYDYPVSHIDLVPTLLDLLGEEIPSALPGKSLVDILTGELNCPSGSVVVEWNAARQGLDAPDGGAVGMREEMIRLGEEAYGRQRSESAVRSDGRSLIAPNGWKYNLYADGIEELFNLELDPHELTNLTDDQQYIVLKQDLQDQLQAWMLHNDDSFTRSSL